MFRFYILTISRLVQAMTNCSSKAEMKLVQEGSISSHYRLALAVTTHIYSISQLGFKWNVSAQRWQYPLGGNATAGISIKVHVGTKKKKPQVSNYLDEPIRLRCKGLWVLDFCFLDLLYRHSSSNVLVKWLGGWHIFGMAGYMWKLYFCLHAIPWLMMCKPFYLLLDLDTNKRTKPFHSNFFFFFFLLSFLNTIVHHYD